MGILAHQTERTDRADRRTRVPSTRHRWLPATLAALATLATLAGCGQVVTHPGTVASGSPKPQATSTPTPIRLTWQAATAPTGGYASVYVPAPSDGNIAYACGMVGSSQSPRVAIWRTQDRGATWSSAVVLPYSGAFSRCTLTVDANDPQVLLAVIDTYTGSQGAVPPPSDYLSFFSHDGGVTWQALPQAGPHIFYSLASYNGTLYAAGDGIGSSGGEAQGVWASHDDGHTWTARNSTTLQPNPGIWVNPRTGELLGSNNYDLIPTLSRSEDGGVTWTKINLPTAVGAGAEQKITVGPVNAGWRICLSGATSMALDAKNVLECSEDLGATWTHPPALNPSELSPKGFTFTAGVDIYAVTSGGALLAWYDDPNADIQIAALALGASAWTPIVATESDGTFVNAGTAAITLTYTPTPGDGLLWVASGTQTPPFFTATYP